MARLAASWIVGLMLGAALVGGQPAVAEDRIGALTATVVESKSERERIAAVTSLARIEDKAALRPLVTALSDASPTVRGIAAIGLGKLGHKAAVPALRTAAAHDTDATVRQRCAEALSKVVAINHLPAEPVAAVTVSTTAASPPAATAAAKIHVAIRSVTDESPGQADVRARKGHADVLRQTLAEEIAASPLFAPPAGVKTGLGTRQLDVSVVRLETRTRKGVIEVEAQLRLTISDERGKMLSFLSGGAKMQVKRKGYNLAYLPQLRRDTVINAVRGLSGNLIEHLRRSMRS